MAEEKKRKRVVVEEVAEETPVETKPEVVDDTNTSEDTAIETAPVEVVEKSQEEAPVIVEETKAPEPDKIVAPQKEYKEKKSFNLFFFFLILFFAFLITVFIGGIYVYLNGTQSGGNTTAPTSIPAMTPEATPQATAQASSTPVPANVKISILNGSGKSGEAGKAKALLEKVGFNVESTGNASAFNFTDTQIQVKAGVSGDTVTKIKDSLKGTYSVVDGKALDTKSQFDVVITVGSKAAN